MMRTAALLLILALPTALSGCFIFGGDDQEKDKGAMTSQMAAEGANNVDAVASTPPSPWRSIELEDDRHSSVGFLPIAAIVLSILSLGLTAVQWVRHRRRQAPPV